MTLESRTTIIRLCGWPWTTGLMLVLAGLCVTAASAQGLNQTSGPWVMERSGTTAGLRGIHAVGGGVAWASGTNGTVLRTEDGGYEWQSCAVPAGAEKLDFRGVWAWDANTAIVMSSGPGDASRLYKTTDGCSSWKLLFTNPDKDGFWDAVAFAPPRPGIPVSHGHGILTGDPVDDVFAVFESRDSGEHWTRWNQDDKQHSPRAHAGESLFAAANQAAITPGNNGPFAFITGGADSRLYEAEAHSPFDAALWWALGSTSLKFAPGKSSGAFAIGERPCSDHSHADFMIVGGDYEKPNSPALSVFVPGRRRPLIGYRAIRYSKRPPHGYRSAVRWYEPAKAWIAVGTNGSDISYDDGKTWEPLDDGNWNALSLPWVVGPQGRIAKLGKLPGK